MSSRIFEAALGNRLMTIILIVVFVAIGLRAMVTLPIDASPDVTPNVVQIVTDAPGLGAAEVENLIDVIDVFCVVNETLLVSVFRVNFDPKLAIDFEAIIDGERKRRHDRVP